MGRRGLLVVAALALSACTFSSEDAFFGESDGALVFSEHQLLQFTDGRTGERKVLRFDRAGAGYDFRPVNEREAVHVVFVPVAETPEEDYVAQIPIGRDASAGVAYAFMWQTREGWRVFASPRGYNGSGEIPARDIPDGEAHFCHPAGLGECRFDSRGDLLGYYSEAIYPVFVHGDGAPAHYLDLAPISDNDGAGPPERSHK